ncbi:MAG: DUF2256 domain-containing protein [Geminicoccaceae bacterium]|nr:DUF2256 domain-containing protein [Geminicoccaceae bacterium]MCX8101274.1 DUF2256 domain-containing protein [Geminicoccaceae bacterium]MDW8370744.1 DUF2256 domain-containing protein [Geminicoccaceae bacterium]
MHKKPHLPTKTCPACGRPFAWRKRWARVWEEVVWCSQRCRRTGRRSGAQPSRSPESPAAATAPPPSRGKSGSA